jgi:hypothetical protein
MCGLKYCLHQDHVQQSNREQGAKNHRQLKIQGSVTVCDIEFRFHVEENDRLIHANRNNDAEKNRVFLPPPFHASMKADRKQNSKGWQCHHKPEPCRHEPAAGTGQISDSEDGIGDDGEAHRNSRPMDGVLC